MPAKTLAAAFVVTGSLFIPLSATAEEPCVDKIVQTVGVCTGCYYCDSDTPDGYCDCERFDTCGASCDQYLFYSPYCPNWGCGAFASDTTSKLGYPRACRVVTPAPRTGVDPIP